jgi:hypothetical protein
MVSLNNTVCRSFLRPATIRIGPNQTMRFGTLRFPIARRDTKFRHARFLDDRNLIALFRSLCPNVDRGKPTKCNQFRTPGAHSGGGHLKAGWPGKRESRPRMSRLRLTSVTAEKKGKREDGRWGRRSAYRSPRQRQSARHGGSVDGPRGWSLRL